MILKRIFAIFAVAVLMLTSACSITKEVEANAVPIAFTEMNNYYVKNGVNTNKPLRYSDHNFGNMVRTDAASQDLLDVWVNTPHEKLTPVQISNYF